MSARRALVDGLLGGDAELRLAESRSLATAQRNKLLAPGGAPWVRARIDKAKVPTAE